MDFEKFEDEDWFFKLTTTSEMLERLTDEEKKSKNHRSYGVMKVACEILNCPENYDEQFPWDGKVLGLDMNTKTNKGRYEEVTFHLYIEISEGVEVWSGELTKWSDTCGCWPGLDIFAEYHEECGKQQTEVERILKENGLLEGELKTLDIYTIPRDVYDEIVEFTKEMELIAWEDLHDSW